MRIAFLADIHGNLPALEAVIDDLSITSPDAVYLVGDQINRLPWSNEVVDLLADRGWEGIRGNHEDVVIHLAAAREPHKFGDRTRFADLWWTVERLRPDLLRRIRALPDEMSVNPGDGGSIRVVHGAPGDPFRGLFNSTDADTLHELLSEVREPVVVCGHTHRPLMRTVGRWRVFNGGSVGNPYNGDARAQYLLLTSYGGEWIPIYRRVEYPLRLIRDAFKRYDLFTEYGPLAEIHLRAIETGEPWVSDFGFWLNNRRPDLQSRLVHAIEIYEMQHGPGRWSFEEM